MSTITTTRPMGGVPLVRVPPVKLAGLPEPDVEAQRLRYGLVSYWPLDEASGSRRDVVGSNTLTDNNTVTGGAGPSTVQQKASQFTAASSESLSIVTNATLAMGDIYLIVRARMLQDSQGANTIIAKFFTTGNQREWEFRYAASVWNVLISPDGTSTGNVSLNAFTPPAGVGKWGYCSFWHDPDRNSVGIQANCGTPNTAVHTTGVFAGTSNLYIGARPNGSNFWDGRLSNIGLWKRVRATPSADVYLFNRGQGRNFTPSRGFW